MTAKAKTKLQRRRVTRQGRGVAVLGGRYDANAHVNPIGRISVSVIQRMMADDALRAYPTYEHCYDAAGNRSSLEYPGTPGVYGELCVRRTRPPEGRERKRQHGAR